MRRAILSGILWFLVTACSTQGFQPEALPNPTQAVALTATQEPAQGQLPPATAIEATPLDAAVATPEATPSTGPTTEPEPGATMALQPEPPDIGGGSVTSFPDPAAYQWIEVGSGFKQALFLTGAGDGSGRLFIVSQAGQIEILQNGQKLPEPFLDISDRTTRPGITGSLGERGLLGLAFHPRYAENGFFFVNYTDRNGNTHISRFNVSAQDPNRADRDSEVELLFIEQPFPNHNGGGLAFGPDGYLYIALGDGGSGGDPQGNGQSLNTLLGKILRIDVDSRQPYAIPPDNPFAGEGGLGEIWAYGLRNPWRIAFDRLTGDFYIADVGQNQYEEINFQAAGGPGGENYGWDFREASHPFEGTPPEGLALVEPIAEYSHELGCSVTGGDVYRGMNLPAWQGVYFYGDYCSGRVWGLLRDPTGRWENRLLFETGFTITSFGLDEEGEVYVIQYPQGKVFRLDQR